MNPANTIAALCTPQGKGALALIRVTGPEAIQLFSKVFVPLNKDFDFENSAQGNKIYNGYVTDINGDTLDRAVVLVFKAPHSYTGEDTVEISCHASSYILQQVLGALFECGVIPAQPGEFTQRAFLNKKMDLTQAEAVADLIASGTKANHQLAINQMKGGISIEISRLREKLLKFVSLVELELDFSEEDVEFADRTELKGILTEVENYLSKLVSSFATGNAIKNGIPVAIAGFPNAGKSTLLNALLNEDKAIVSDIPGTTRDIIEDVTVIDGISYRFIDTAGIRQTSDLIENLGIDRAKKAVDKASILILVIDPQPSINEQINQIVPQDFDGLLIVAVNKSDIADCDIDIISAEKTISELNINDYKIINISAKKNIGLDKLQDIISNYENGKISQSDYILTNARHQILFKKSLESIQRAHEGLKAGISGEFFSQDIREAMQYFGEITGNEITPDEVLGNIFKNFCIGK